MSVVELTESAFDSQNMGGRLAQKKRAFEDLQQGCKQWPIWLKLAWQDIYLRYRRSVIGPFWITLSMAIMVYSMGFLYAHLWHVPMATYLPYLASGIVAWNFISNLIIESTDVYLLSGSLIRQIKLPYSLYIHRMCMRNVMIFFHNILVMLPIYFIFYRQIHINFSFVFFWVDLCVLYVNVFLFANIVGIVCARYRDLGQVFKSLVQVCFFLTPILWDIQTLPERLQFIASLNPFYVFVELIREPVLGHYPTLANYGVVGVSTLIGVLLNYVLFVKYRSRIVYWL
jgi:ABC-type polysaccharide/polyol phosphate export permease